MAAGEISLSVSIIEFFFFSMKALLTLAAFLTPHYPTFPFRKAAVDKVWELCTEWVGQNKVLKRGKRKGELNDKFVVVLHTPARYKGKIFQISGIKR